MNKSAEPVHVWRLLDAQVRPTVGPHLAVTLLTGVSVGQLWSGRYSLPLLVAAVVSVLATLSLTADMLVQLKRTRTEVSDEGVRVVEWWSKFYGWDDIDTVKTNAPAMGLTLLLKNGTPVDLPAPSAAAMVNLDQVRDARSVIETRISRNRADTPAGD